MYTAGSMNVFCNLHICQTRQSATVVNRSRCGAWCAALAFALHGVAWSTADFSPGVVPALHAVRKPFGGVP